MYSNATRSHDNVDIKIPVAPSGTLSPMSGLGTPAEPNNLAKD